METFHFCNDSFRFEHTTISQYYYYSENKCSIHHIVFRQKSQNIYLKNARKYCLTIMSFATLLFLQMKNSLKLIFFLQDTSDLTHQHFPTTAHFEKNSPNLDSPCALVLCACSSPALGSPGMDPIPGFHMPSTPLSHTQAAISQKNHFQVSYLVESATCPSSLCKNPELLCCRAMRNSSFS